MNSAVQADAKFLRRVLMILVALTIVAGGMIAFTTSQALSEVETPAQTSAAE
jgi:hypothetical protein